MKTESKDKHAVDATIFKSKAHGGIQDMESARVDAETAARTSVSSAEREVRTHADALQTVESDMADFKKRVVKSERTMSERLGETVASQQNRIDFLKNWQEKWHTDSA